MSDEHLAWELDDDDIPKRTGFGPGELSTLADLVGELDELDKKIAKLDDERAALASKRKQIAQHDIPLLFAECGNVAVIGFTDGTKVSVKKDLKAGLVKEEARRRMQIAWLDDHGLSAIVKRFVTGQVPRERAELLEAGRHALLAIGVTDTIVGLDVHNGQLVSNLKQLREQGIALPVIQGADGPVKLFGHYELREARIVRPR